MNWTKWITYLLPNLVASISQPLRQELVTFVKQFKAKTEKSENPWDKFAAAVFCWVVGIDE